MRRRVQLLCVVLLFQYVRCQQNQLKLSTASRDGSDTSEELGCTEKSQKFFNLTTKSLQSFCQLDSVTDMLQYTSGQVEACCKLDLGIITNICFDPCEQQNNPHNSLNIIIDLWRALCRFDQLECQQVRTYSVTDEQQQQQQQQVEMEVQSSPSPIRSDVNLEQEVPLIPLLGQVPGFSFLLYYLQKAGIVLQIQNSNQPFTLFAPSNSAFAKFAEQYGVASNMLDIVIPNWTEILWYHLILGVHRLDEIQKDEILITYQGQVVVVRASQEAGVGLIQSCCVIQSMAELLAQDYVVKEGILHAIDTILIPHDIKL